MPPLISQYGNPTTTPSMTRKVVATLMKQLHISVMKVYVLGSQSTMYFVALYWLYDLGI